MRGFGKPAARDDTRPVFGEAKAPIPAHTLGEVYAWAAGTPQEEAVADAAITDEAIRQALGETESHTCTCVAQHLSQQTGVFIPQSLVRRRIAANPHLQDAQVASGQKQLAAGVRRFSEAKRANELGSEARRHTRAETRSRRRTRRERRQALQCGAQTRAGRPCQRKPVPGKTSCANHGGLSSGRPRKTK